MKGRTIPLQVVTKWKEVYGDDLIALSKDTNEPNVSRETKSNMTSPNGVKVIELDVWQRLERNFDQFAKNSDVFESELLFLREIIRNMSRQSIDPNKM